VSENMNSCRHICAIFSGQVVLSVGDPSETSRPRFENAVSLGRVNSKLICQLGKSILVDEYTPIGAGGSLSAVISTARTITC